MHNFKWNSFCAYQLQSFYFHASWMWTLIHFPPSISLILIHTEAQSATLSFHTSYYLIWINWVESLASLPSQYNFFFSEFSEEANFVVMAFYFCGLICVTVTPESVTSANTLSFNVINIPRSHTHTSVL